MDNATQLAQELMHLPVETRWLLRGIQIGMLMAAEVQTAQQEESSNVCAPNPFFQGSGNNQLD